MHVLYEDNHLIIVSKSAGEIVQGDKTGDTPLSDIVKAYIKEHYAKPGQVFLGVTHRLDRPVSGVVVFARTSKALSRMNILFRDGDVEKTYLAIVADRPPKDEGERSLHQWRSLAQSWRVCAIAWWLPLTIITCWPCACLRDAIIRYAASWLLSAALSRAT